MDLTENDVLEILKLVEQSKFDYFQLEQGELKLTVARNGYVPAGEAPRPPPAANATIPPGSDATDPSPSAPHAEPVPRAAPDDGLFIVVAPMVGTFYAASAPGEPPYVEIGAHVDAGTTLGLIEVMKVFTAIKSDVGGTVEVALIADAQFVEYGQPLFRIRPDSVP